MAAMSPCLSFPKTPRAEAPQGCEVTAQRGTSGRPKTQQLLFLPEAAAAMGGPRQPPVGPRHVAAPRAHPRATSVSGSVPPAPNLARGDDSATRETSCGW